MRELNRLVTVNPDVEFEDAFKIRRSLVPFAKHLLGE